MNIPDNIDSQIAEYLNLEFDSNDIVGDDLEYVGLINNIHYWATTKLERKYWATVESYENSFLIGMTDKKPQID
jgi:hypothetical protein